MSYLENKARLDKAIQEFLDGRGIGRYTDEAHMRSALAAKLRERGFEVEEEKEVTMADGSILRPDIIVQMGEGKVLPLELKYDNPSIDEYEEDEEKCERYMEDFEDVQDAYCIFVSSITHQDYRADEWQECEGNSTYHYIWLIPDEDDHLFL